MSFQDNFKKFMAEQKKKRADAKLEQEIAKMRESGKTGMVQNPGFWGTLADILIMLFLLFIMMISIVPLWHVVMSSFSDGKELLGHSGVVWLPIGRFNLGGYGLLFRDSSILMGYANTLLYVFGGTALGLLMNAVGGYILSRDTKLKPAITLFVVFTTMFHGGTVPTYMVIRALGMTGTRWALIIPGATNAMFMLMVANSFAAVDKSYVEAAAIDGAGHLDTLFKVLLPQAKGMLMVTAINSAIMKWNSWFEASIYVPTQRDCWPLQLWVKQYTASTTDFLKSQNPNYDRWLIQYAVIVIATAPILIALPFFISKLEKGMVLGGVKG